MEKETKSVSRDKIPKELMEEIRLCEICKITSDATLTCGFHTIEIDKVMASGRI